MSEEREHEFVDATNHAFGFPVLLGGVWTRKSDMKTGDCGKLMEVVIVKFSSFVTLKGFDGSVELSLYEFVEAFEFVISFRFKF